MNLPVFRFDQAGRASLIAIETRRLTRHFGKVTAVENLNLRVPAGALYGLIGPNGAGKTTTLRMLAGLLEPTAGEIVLNGQVAGRDWRELRRQIGYMPDFFGVYEDMLVWEYLDFFARCYDLPPDHRQQVTDELLDLVDLAEKRDAYVQTLSRGMRQRLCLAHALVHDPQVLLLDEPASGLDPRARVEMRELLRELGAMGKTIVVSSHILAELAELCDSVGIIEKGRLVVSGPLAEISRHVRQGRTLRLKVLSDRDEAEVALRDQPGVGEVYEINGFLEVEFLGDDEATALLLATLVACGVKVVSFSEVSSDLEEIFLRLTRGEVA
jgi:ABC-2 type transport system ATP-binding protein